MKLFIMLFVFLLICLIGLCKKLKKIKAEINKKEKSRKPKSDMRPEIPVGAREKLIKTTVFITIITLVLIAILILTIGVQF